ncbi:MAG: zinc ribbon domain-containing protein [Sulfurovaceae bacterium]|nr:zinc ribbon domain-containing protein [Sulfurovaceae bacterium]
MALTSCFECGKQISDKATACPNCGAPIGKVLKENVSPQNTKTTENSKEIHTEESSSEPLSSLTSITIGWIFGILLSLGFLGALTSGNIATSFFYLIGALFLLPPVRKKVFQKTKLSIPLAYRIAIVIGSIFIATIALQRAESAHADEATQNAKEKRIKEFLSQKNSLLKQVQRQVQDKNYEHALPVCNKYMDLSDKDLSTLCNKVKDEVSKKNAIGSKKSSRRAKNSS